MTKRLVKQGIALLAIMGLSVNVMTASSSLQSDSAAPAFTNVVDQGFPLPPPPGDPIGGGEQN